MCNPNKKIDPEIVYNNWKDIKYLHFYEENAYDNDVTNYHFTFKNYNCSISLKRFEKIDKKQFVNNLSMKDLYRLLCIDHTIGNKTALSNELAISRITLNKALKKARHVFGYIKEDNRAQLMIEDLYHSGEFNITQIMDIIKKRGFNISYYKIRKIIND